MGVFTHVCLFLPRLCVRVYTHTGILHPRPTSRWSPRSCSPSARAAVTRHCPRGNREHDSQLVQPQSALSLHAHRHQHRLPRGRFTTCANHRVVPADTRRVSSEPRQQGLRLLSRCPHFRCPPRTPEAAPAPALVVPAKPLPWTLHRAMSTPVQTTTTSTRRDRWPEHQRPSPLTRWQPWPPR